MGWFFFAFVLEICCTGIAIWWACWLAWLAIIFVVANAVVAIARLDHASEKISLSIVYLDAMAFLTALKAVALIALQFLRESSIFLGITIGISICFYAFMLISIWWFAHVYLQRKREKRAMVKQ